MHQRRRPDARQSVSSQQQRPDARDAGRRHRDDVIVDGSGKQRRRPNGQLVGRQVDRGRQVVPDGRWHVGQIQAVAAERSSFSGRAPARRRTRGQAVTVGDQQVAQTRMEVGDCETKNEEKPYGGRNERDQYRTRATFADDASGCTATPRQRFHSRPLRDVIG